MVAVVLIGTQWGDEGKGKITDILSEDFHAVVRYQGGNNAGHTIVIDGRDHKLHIVPSGVLRGEKKAVIGDGCVVDPWVLKAELDKLEAANISTEDVILSDRAHLIMPYHRSLDSMQERSRKGSKVGTTKRGIGPCYEDKAARTGIRAGDLLYPSTLRKKIEAGCSRASLIARAMGLELDDAPDPARIFAEITELKERLKPHIRDVPAYLNMLLDSGEDILLEGAQGAFLDLDRGTYPFVTSSSCTAGYASGGSGIGPLDIEKVVGVVKAYTTRVGEGPFPTELNNKIGERIRERGGEIGTTTERPRRCGWLDLVMVRSSVRWNSVTELALTKVDVLSGMDPVMVCTEYRIPNDVAEVHGLGTTLRSFPSSLEVLDHIIPVYQKVKGWRDMDPYDWEQVKVSGEMPKPLREYIRLIERQVLSTISILSYGPGREQTIRLGSDLV